MLNGPLDVLADDHLATVVAADTVGIHPAAIDGSRALVLPADNLAINAAYTRYFPLLDLRHARLRSAEIAYFTQT